MYTKTTLGPGREATADDIHEDAARQQLTALYEKQNTPATAAPSAAAPPKPAAQNTASAEPAAKPEPTPTPAKTSTGSLLDALVPSAAAADDRLAQTIPKQASGIIDNHLNKTLESAASKMITERYGENAKEFGQNGFGYKAVTDEMGDSPYLKAKWKEGADLYKKWQEEQAKKQ